MHRYITRACAAATAGIALAAVGVTGATASDAAPRAVPGVRVTGAGPSLAATSPGTQLWAARYDNTGNGGATAAAASPNGKTVFVTGYTTAGSTEDYTTVAYDAATGTQQWLARYNGPVNFTDEAYSVAVSPSGDTVYVTGESAGTDDGWDSATVAYNATTGAQLWVKRYNGAGLGSKAFSVAVSPTAGTVFITGYSVDGGSDYATVAYDG